MNDDKIEQLKAQERELRESMKDVQETVSDLNREEAGFSRRRDEVNAMLKSVEKRRHQAEQGDREQRERDAVRREASFKGRPEDTPESRREVLDHTRARLRASRDQIESDLAELEERRRPFVLTQRQLSEQIDQCVDRQYRVHLDPTLSVTETKSMNPAESKSAAAEPFRRAASGNDEAPGQALASTQRLDELKKQLDQPTPAPQLNPPGMKPDVGKHVRDNKAIGDEILRIQNAIANRRGQAREGFKRSSGG